jgi:aspartyl-tRNA(Asn)/glutamyl-tRNA(Gln) amidotransferase subunit C
MLKEDVVEKVAQLARLKLTEEEKETIGKQLMSILEFVNQLNEVSTEGVGAVWDGQEGTPLREDVPKREFSQEKALANAPEREDGFFVVPKILEL